LLLNLSDDMLDALRGQQLERYFTVEELAANETREALLAQLAVAGEEQPAFIVSIPGRQVLLRLNERGLARMKESGHSEAWNGLDVAVAHMLLLGGILGMSAEDVETGRYIRYTPDAEQALRAVQAEEAQAALLLNGTRVRQIRDVSQAEEVMPQKATYFYPKLITGLVLNPLW
jgi:hypothetical protein